MEQNEIKLTPTVIILRLIEFKNLVLKSWKIILITVIVCGAIGYMVDSKKKHRTVYVAGTTFNLSAGGNETGGFSGLSMLGLGGSSSDASMFAGENFFALAKSRPVINKAMSKKITMGNKTDYFINFYLDSTYIRQDEFEAPHEKQMLGVRFSEKNINREIMNANDKDVFDRVFLRLRDETVITQPDKKVSYILLEASLENEMLSKIWVELLLETLEEVYQKNQTKKSREMEKILERRVDSLSRVLNHTENRLAKVTDVNVDAVVVTGRVEQTRLTRSSTFVSSLYLEASRNLESVRMSIIKEAPLFTIIEPVYMPLDEKRFTIDNTAFGLVIGLFLSFLIIAVRQAYLNALKEGGQTSKK